MTYQWYSNTTQSNSGGTPIDGATSSTNTPATSNAGTTYYYCVVTNSCGSISSSVSGAIIVNNVPELSINDVLVNENDGTAQFTASLSQAIPCDVTFDVATSDNTALAGSDYTGITTTQYTNPEEALLYQSM